MKQSIWRIALITFSSVFLVMTIAVHITVNNMLLVSTNNPLLVEINSGRTSSSSEANEVSDVQLEVLEIELMRCRQSNEIPTDQFVGIMHLRNTDLSKYYSYGKSQLLFLDESDAINGGFQISGFRIPAGGDIAITSSDFLNSYLSFRILGGKYRDFRFNIQGSSSGVIDPNERIVSPIIELIELETSSEKYPRRRMLIQATNPSGINLFRVRILAAVYNSDGNLVDILWSEKPGTWQSGKRINSNKGEEFTLASIAKTGICLGLFDPEGYQIELWLTAMLPSGYPIVHNETFEVNND